VAKLKSGNRNGKEFLKEDFSVLIPLINIFNLKVFIDLYYGIYVLFFPYF